MYQLFQMFCSVLPLLLAILSHGLGHIVAAKMLGVRMPRLIRTATGFRLIAANGFPSYDAELYCALGGPVANVGSCMVYRLILFLCPGTASLLSPTITVSLYLGLFNLLPLRGFDGARILHCLLCCRHRRLSSLTPARADRLIEAISALLLFFFWLISLYLLLRRGSALSLYLFCFQLFRSVITDQSLSKNQGFRSI
jgi:membrane-associated protease RseP (regulator of RpoE activity)